MIFFSFTIASKNKERVLFSPCKLSNIDPRVEKRDKVKKLPDYKALWDTGAANTVISQSVVKKFKLFPIGKTQIIHVGGTDTANIYLLDIHLPNTLTIQTVKVIQAPLNGFDILIGMDIIGLGDFAVSNFNDQTTFSFRYPSKEKIDFEAGEG